MQNDVAILLRDYSNELKQELNSILDYWKQFTIDHEFGGFAGKINNYNEADKKAEKGIVLNSRILWAFSSAYDNTKTPEYLLIAERAYDYIINYFIDKKFDGVFWSVSYKGEMLNDRKQIYGLSFCIYGLSEYFKASGNNNALELAKELFHLIEKYSYDSERGGYFEAFTRDWQVMNDVRLSEKDANEKKTMNTHLHIIEAYSNLYTVWKNEELKSKIEGLLDIFRNHIINHRNYHLHLFMDDDWNVKNDIISFGHDIEAAWLLQQSAETAGTDDQKNEFTNMASEITNASITGLDKDGGLWYEYAEGKHVLTKEKHSWPQAEAMIGFFNAWQNTGDINYLQHSLNSWAFIKKKIKDVKNGEWFWGIDKDDKPIEGQDKAGFWKCPYHNSRACLEIVSRIEKYLH